MTSIISIFASKYFFKETNNDFFFFFFLALIRDNAKVINTLNLLGGLLPITRLSEVWDLQV